MRFGSRSRRVVKEGVWRLWGTTKDDTLCGGGGKRGRKKMSPSVGGRGPLRCEENTCWRGKDNKESIGGPNETDLFAEKDISDDPVCFIKKNSGESRRRQQKETARTGVLLGVV